MCYSSNSEGDIYYLLNSKREREKKEEEEEDDDDGEMKRRSIINGLSFTFSLFIINVSTL